MDYKSSGVDIEAGDKFVDYIKGNVKKTFKPQVLGGIGGFASLFSLQNLGINLNDATLVSSTDGVGTKLKIAQAIGKHDTIGIDLVAMCVNDLLCQGAQPLFFLDYIACGKIQEPMLQQIMDGIIEGCLRGKMSLIGGETAEMPGIYEEEVYDLAGFSVGILEQSKILPKINEMSDGDLVIGLHSSGLHSNGFSLVRKIMEANDIDYNFLCPFADMTWGEFLLTPTQIYTDICQKLFSCVKGFAHITGGGITENLPRVLPKNMNAIIDRKSWKLPEIFQWLQKNGDIDIEEMHRVFNMGIGMIAICSPDQIKNIKDIIGEDYSIIGKLQKSNTENSCVEYI